MLSRDTAADVENLQVALWQRMPPEAKLASAAGATDAVLALAAAGVRSRAPSATPREHFRALAVLKLGPAIVTSAYGDTGGVQAMASINPFQVALLVSRVLEDCGLRYVLGGSLASSVSGEPRSTLDIDVMVDLSLAAIEGLVAALGSDFYADAAALARAVRTRSSANIVHLPSATKVDFFIMGATAIEPRQMERRRTVTVATGEAGEAAQLYVYTPEDILLQKLRWYRLGGEVSDRQWRDVLGIVAVQGERLDLEYLRTSAAEIDILDLLERAVAE
jgi:hypothetical protein